MVRKRNHPSMERFSSLQVSKEIYSSHSNLLQGDRSMKVGLYVFIWVQLDAWSPLLSLHTISTLLFFLASPESLIGQASQAKPPIRLPRAFLSLHGKQSNLDNKSKRLPDVDVVSMTRKASKRVSSCRLLTSV